MISGRARPWAEVSTTEEGGGAGSEVSARGGEISRVLVEALGVIVVGGHAHLGGDVGGIELEAVGVEVEPHGASFSDECDQLRWEF